MATTSRPSMPISLPREADLVHLSPYQRHRALAPVRAAVRQQGFTLCDLLRLPDPQPLIEAVSQRLDFIPGVQLLRQWFQWSDSPLVVRDMTRRMSEFVTRCGTTDLAPWATYTGDIYRGVHRTLNDTKAYDFTKAEVRTLSLWRTVSFRTSYQSQYPVQSWTSSWNRAVFFAKKGGGGGRRGDHVVPVVFTSRATPQNSLFSPAVSNVIAHMAIGWTEDEVIRTTKEIDPAMTGIILLDDHRPWRVYDDWWNSGVFPSSVMEALRASWRGVTK